MDEPLHTPRLRLEPQCAGHADEMYAVLVDPAIYVHEHAPPPSADDLRRRYARLEARVSPDGRERWLNWVLRLADGGEAIGYVQATVHPDGTADIAYVLGSRWWGRGLASEAVRGMIDELRERHGVRRLRAVLKAANARSLALLERLGFAPATAEEAAGADVDDGERVLARAAGPAAGP